MLTFEFLKLILGVSVQEYNRIKYMKHVTGGTTLIT